MKFPCPQCGRPIAADPQMVGLQTTCLSCGCEAVIPTPPEPDALDIGVRRASSRGRARGATTHFDCPKCHTLLEIDDAKLGTRIRCPVCSLISLVPKRTAIPPRPLARASDFRFACPRCGQHIACEEACCGLQIECPACRAKIKVPQSGRPVAPPIDVPAPAPEAWAPPARPQAFSLPDSAAPLPAVTRRPVWPTICVLGMAVVLGAAIVSWFFRFDRRMPISVGQTAAAEPPDESKPNDGLPRSAQDAQQKPSSPARAHPTRPPEPQRRQVGEGAPATAGAGEGDGVEHPTDPSATAAETGVDENAPLSVVTNPDNVSVTLRRYTVTSAALAQIEFRSGFGGDSSRLEGHSQLSGFVAVVAEWKVTAGTDVAPGGLRPALKGIRKVPSQYGQSFQGGKYEAVGICMNWRSCWAMWNATTGAFAGVLANGDDTARFLWFVPKDTKSFQVVLPAHQPIDVVVGKTSASTSHQGGQRDGAT